MSPDSLRPIVFLDIDDVLCMSWPFGGRDVLAAYAGMRHDLQEMLPLLFSSRALNVLRRAHDKMGGQLSYVLSSTWREEFSREQMIEILTGAGAGFVADNLREGDAWRTPIHEGMVVRLCEIEDWLEAHGRGEPFVIIDDTYSGKSLMVAQADETHPWHWRIVICEEFVGLVEEHLYEMLTALKLRTK
jgi:hypothetical protein